MCVLISVSMTALNFTLLKYYYIPIHKTMKTRAEFSFQTFNLVIIITVLA